MEIFELKEMWYLIIFISVLAFFITLLNLNMFGLNPYNEQNFSNPEYKNEFGIKSETEAQALMLRMSFGYYF